MCRPASQPLAALGHCASSHTEALSLAWRAGGAHGELECCGDWAPRALIRTCLRRSDGAASSPLTFLTRAFAVGGGRACRAGHAVQVGEGRGGAAEVCLGALHLTHVLAVPWSRVTLNALVDASPLRRTFDVSDGRLPELPLLCGLVLEERSRLAQAEDGFSGTRGSASAWLGRGSGARGAPGRRLFPRRGCVHAQCLV